MKVTIDNNYGADADGNRGMRVYEYEIEPSDRDDIVEQLVKALDEGILDETDSIFTISLHCPYTKEIIGIEVAIDDYIGIKEIK